MVTTQGSAVSTSSADDDDTERSYYSISEVAALLGVSRVSVWRWISSGRLPVTRLGHRTVRIQRADLDQITRPAQSLDGAASARSVGGSAPRAEWLKASAPDHRVLFYDADQFLIDEVSDFIAAGLTAGERGIVVATPEHVEGIEARLRATGIDTICARTDGLLVELDAAQTLSTFMVDGAPDPARFGDVVTSLVGRTINGGRASRVFGEMVALLVGRGNPQAAIGLEALWSRMQAKHGFPLLCAYPMEQMGGDVHAGTFAEVCSEHTSVVPTESYSALDATEDRLREIVALQQKAASLERALFAERAARDQAEAALRTREEFLSIASHELRTPITVLGAQAQLSLRRLERAGQLEPERVAQTLRTIGSQADKLARLVGQLLDVSRIDSGKLDIEPVPTDLVQVVGQVVSATGSLTDRHSITLMGLSSVLCTVDALRVEQVLTNLLDNAIKYSPDGGSIEVDVVLPTPEYVQVSVRDHGLGIPPEKRDRIFERFYQAHDNGFRSGMGLGLFVCRQIVELHGGEVRAEFPPDGGTRVIVQLPLRIASVRASAAAD